MPGGAASACATVRCAPWGAVSPPDVPGRISDRDHYASPTMADGTRNHDADHGSEGGGTERGQRGLDELVAERRRKLAELRDAGVDPYPRSFAGRAEIAAVLQHYANLSDGEETSDGVRLAGRLAARRGHGKATFLDLADRSGRIQLHARVDVLGEHSYERFAGLDLGDIVGIEGAPFRTRRGELSVRVDEWALLAKAVMPLPDKHHGLADVETRYRQRELDLIANPDARELFALRSKVIAAAREFLDERGFLEVETPVLQPIYGGALARPFTTHHNALDRTLYLRIATELYLKRLIVGGLEKVYELGKDFRNEGLSPKHNPEFTMLETYEAYADYLDVARMTEELVSYVARETIGTTIIERDGRATELSPPWRRVTLREIIVGETGIDIGELTEKDDLVAAMQQAGLWQDDLAPHGWGKLVDELLSKHVEPKLIEPTFVLDYPTELSPFAKAHRSKTGLVERFEAFVLGMEIANAFSELNDPDEQRDRMKQQARLREAGDEETQPFDAEFVRALEYGMPPTGGLGLGIDRLVMVLSGRDAIREVVLFPALRERGEGPAPNA
jgi:lysyl-tRNA synthetase class 2